MKKKLKTLWLAPNLNHYKARFLNHLANESDVDLTILSGTGRNQMGDLELIQDWGFQHVKVNVPKKTFGNSKIVKEQLATIFNQFDWVLIPAEKKNLLLFLFALKLRKKNTSVRLFSYNHPTLKSKNGKITILDKLITKFYYKKLDRVIFYTESSCKWAVKSNLIKQQKAFWANNTVDNTEIDKYYSYQLPPENKPKILFIGRLIASKRIEDLIIYYNQLKLNMSNLTLDIIGDGPENELVRDIVISDKSITWHGAIVDEAKIAPIMKESSLVFVPGHSGLSINHAFAYGRPYITIEGPSHAPEISYIQQGLNGYVLKNNLEFNINIFKKILTDNNVLKKLCNKAKLDGEYLSVQRWSNQFIESLKDA